MYSRQEDLTKGISLVLMQLNCIQAYFEFELVFFQQAKGTPMGGPLSRLLADLILENKIEYKIQQIGNGNICSTEAGLL